MSSDTNDDGAAANQLKLTHLIGDCLEHIFMYLGYEDLLSIADTNKGLKPSAEIVFARKFGKKKITMSMNTYVQRVSSLRLLRCFGHLITKLDFRGSFDGRYINHLFDYLLEYCSKSLIELQLFFIRNGLFNCEHRTMKPFLKVETLSITFGDLGVEMNDLSAWFPVIHSLKLTGVKFRNCAAIEKHFPNFRHLAFLYGKIPIESVLRLNPQLQRLELYSLEEKADSLNLLRYASEYLSHLDFLGLYGKPNIFCALRGDMINFKTVKKLVIVFDDAIASTISNINLLFDRLEDIDLNLDLYEWTNGLTSFFGKHQSIMKVTLRACFSNTPATNERVLAEVVRALPLLTELYVIGPCYSVDEFQLVWIGNEFKLVKYSFDLKVPRELNSENQRAYIEHQFNILKSRLGNKWQATKSYSRLNRVNVERSI